MEPISTVVTSRQDKGDKHIQQRLKNDAQAAMPASFSFIENLFLVFAW